MFQLLFVSSYVSFEVYLSSEREFHADGPENETPSRQTSYGTVELCSRCILHAIGTVASRASRYTTCNVSFSEYRQPMEQNEAMYNMFSSTEAENMTNWHVLKVVQWRRVFSGTASSTKLQ